MCRPAGRSSHARHTDDHAVRSVHSSPERRPAHGPDREHLRASDADREAAVEMLRGHAAAGRLDVDELDSRMDAAFSARTLGELAALSADLPGDERPPARAVAPPRHRRGPEVSAYLWVMTMLVGIWLLTGAGHPWPLYPALGWGIPLLLSGATRRPAPPAAPAGMPRLR